MSVILDIITNGDVWIVTLDVNPVTSGGVDAPIGSYGTAIDGSGIFTKIGVGDTDYISGINPYGGLKTYSLISDFDTGALPTGWNQATSGTGTTNFSQASETGVIGISLIESGIGLGGSSGIQYSSAINYLNRFTDSFFTQISWRQRYGSVPPTANSCSQVGWINSNASIAGASGNALCVMYDPSNISGYNPTLITNLFLLARAVYGAPAANTVVDLGILPDSIGWNNWSIIADNQNNNVRVIRNNTILTTLTDLSNVPAMSVRGAIPVAAGASLQPTFYVGNRTTLVPLTTMSFRIDKMSVYKLYN